MFQGEDLLHRMAALSKQKFMDRRIKVDHPNTKSYNIVLDAYAKQGLVDEAEALHDKMTEISKSSNPECRPDVISKSTLISAYANTKTSKEIYCRKARRILDVMISIHSETGSPNSNLI